jgi:flagellar basal body rod protein FlgB
MLRGLIGPTTVVTGLKEGLDMASASAKWIAQRVANATTPAGPGFEAALGGAGPVDVEAEMVALADEQIRYDAATRLLEKVYAQVRASVKER